MSYGTSIVLIAAGAVLRYAVSVHTSGFNLHTIGLILMIVGAVGLVVSILWMATHHHRTAAAPADGYARRRRWL